MRGSSAAAQVRAFNRFYVPRVVGTSRSYLRSGLTLPEARVVFEVGTRPGCTAQEIRRRVAFDQGHLSRVLGRLHRRGLLAQEPGRDRRTRALRLTPAGARAFRTIDSRADAQATALLAGLGPPARGEALRAMRHLRVLLGDPDVAPPRARIRRMRAGDLGWAFMRQAEIYRSEFGYAPVFETYVARGLPPFLDAFDARRDALWVAEVDGERAGCIAIQHDPGRAGWAKLRWYFVEAHARGHGLGSRLLATSLGFARKAGYRGIYLWTVDDLAAARRQYEGAGFTLAHQDGAPCAWAPWGHEQRWELVLRGRRQASGRGRAAPPAPRSRTSRRSPGRRCAPRPSRRGRR
jgi:DNA-binding MarR family transcriptional regulator/GNAT superfamily N-acetyltransferase